MSPDDGRLYTCGIAHTSSASPTTFTQDNNNNRGRWVPYTDPWGRLRTVAEVTGWRSFFLYRGEAAAAGYMGVIGFMDLSKLSQRRYVPLPNGSANITRTYFARGRPQARNSNRQGDRVARPVPRRPRDHIRFLLNLPDHGHRWRLGIPLPRVSDDGLGTRGQSTSGPSGQRYPCIAPTGWLRCSLYRGEAVS